MSSGRHRLASARLFAAIRAFHRCEVPAGPLRITARVGGRADAAHTIVLLPGLGLAGRYMLPLGAELADEFRVWVPVIPGFGRSDRPPAPLDLPAMGAVVAAFLHAAGIESATLVGNSMGCQVAVEAAIHEPGRVTGLVLDAPTVDSHARSVRQLVWRVLVDATREPPPLGLVQLIEWIQTGPRRLIATTRSALAHRLERRVALVHCPMLAVHSRRDPFAPQRWLDELSAAAPAAAVRVVPTGTHALPYSDPAALAQLVRQFATLTGGGGHMRDRALRPTIETSLQSLP